MATTLKDIAERVGVSITTVSRGLAGYSDVAEETRLRIQQAAEELGYRPNLTARRLKKQQTGVLGFIMPTPKPRFSDPFFSEFIAGIGNEAAAHDYDLLVSTHPPDSEAEMEAYRRALQRDWVDGLIVVRTRVDDARIRLLSEHNFPFVAFGRSGVEVDFPYVDEDGAAGMRLITRHLIDLGHRRIGFVMPPASLAFSHYRLQGFLEAMATQGLPVAEEWLVEGDLTQHGGADAVEQLLAIKPRLTAVICGNDLMAIGAINRIHQNGLRVGQDIAIAGFDDVPMAAFVNPPLTTIHQPIYDIGRRACAMLIDIINGRAVETPHLLLTPTLIIRASSGMALE